MKIYQLNNDSVRMRMTNVGCRVLELRTQDRDGNWEDILLGYADPEDVRKDDAMMNAVVGRVANRIGLGQFELNGVRYQLPVNSGCNHIHGGLIGFDRKEFDADELPDGLRFHYRSPDGEEGYPGALDLWVTFSLCGDTLGITYEAVTDRDTILNVTWHPYFNLTGGRSGILSHRLRIASDRIACVDGNGLPTGKFLPVENTPFDFRTFHEVGERIGEDHEQLRNAGGYDHPFLLKRALGLPAFPEPAVLTEESTGRFVAVDTDLPAIQVYTSNFISGGLPGKKGVPYENRSGIALETEFLPNSIRIEKDPPVILRVGERFRSVTTYRFGVLEKQQLQIRASSQCCSV
ncbi:MAG: galactose mutarotase [Mogibacterium sp.]|nr:galactose mutarotase [Mogibacterium sp.]